MIKKYLLGLMIGSTILGFIVIAIFFLLFVFYGDEIIGGDLPI